MSANVAFWHINCTLEDCFSKTATSEENEMTLRRLVCSAVCLLVVAVSSAAHADTWLYTFSGTNSAPGGNGLTVAFQFSSPASITTNSSLFSTQLTSCTNCLVSSLARQCFFSQVMSMAARFSSMTFEMSPTSTCFRSAVSQTREHTFQGAPSIREC